ncbi:succinate--CoA ligase subunit beta [Mastigocoleus sp. MO_188.B34]|uniref:succinate--CoA ligase subunit beta n=1 Tax=Mastigocoleus sp. MO_188.B34 TaxID=3036635 RepID=UPI00261BEF0B|nr:succinate--CoA ligase subunit beta [Mastigocoleus sp. MO_188.B34]MDJ0695819.1 succinate--CoA ligase subunit beta [Mastigocoleus sp. MO_188.B34]
MDLLEFQVKEWFRTIGIPVLPSQRIDHPTDLKRLKIRYPIVLKSQVHGNKRTKAGGVRFVETTIDAIAAAHNIFNLPILGELPDVLLAEAKFEVHKEFYLAVVLDTALCRPVLLGCNEPDIDWERSENKMQHVVVEQDFSPFYARRLALKMGLRGKIMQSVSAILEKMYRLFTEKDLDLVEINPLAVSNSSEVMALNGNVRVNDRAIARHPEIVTMAAKMTKRSYSSQVSTNFNTWNGLYFKGNVGIIGNGVGSLMTTLDSVTNAGGKPGTCLNLRHSPSIENSSTAFSDRLQNALHMMASDRNTQAILINFLGCIPTSGGVSHAIEKFIQNFENQMKPQIIRFNGNKHLPYQDLPHLVVRLAGSEYKTDRKYLTQLETPDNLALTVVENLDEAVDRTVGLTSSVSL